LNFFVSCELSLAHVGRSSRGVVLPPLQCSFLRVLTAPVCLRVLAVTTTRTPASGAGCTATAGVGAHPPAGLFLPCCRRCNAVRLVSATADRPCSPVRSGLRGGSAESSLVCVDRSSRPAECCRAWYAFSLPLLWCDPACACCPFRFFLPCGCRCLSVPPGSPWWPRRCSGCAV